MIERSQTLARFSEPLRGFTFDEETKFAYHKHPCGAERDLLFGFEGETWG